MDKKTPVAVGETLELLGHKYRAIPSKAPGACGPCCFKAGFGCYLAEKAGEALTQCSAKHRQDGIDVWFEPATARQ